MPVSFAFDSGTGKSLATNSVSDLSDIGEVKLEDERLEVELVLTDSTYESGEVSSYGLTSYEDLVKGSGNNDNSGNTNDHEGVNEEESDSTTKDIVRSPTLIPPSNGNTLENPFGTFDVNTGSTPTADTTPSSPTTVSCLLPEDQSTGTAGIATAPINPGPIPAITGNPATSPLPPSPYPGSLQTSPPPPKGKVFFDPECDTCCHSPTNSPQQFYTLCLLVSTDPLITKMVEGGMIDQVYSSIPVLQAKFEAGQPGAYLQETSFMDMTTDKVESLVNSSLFVNPIVMSRAEPVVGGVLPVMPKIARAYQFQKKFSFKIPKNIKHLTLFNFIRFDELTFNQHYQIPNFSLPSGVYTGPIKELIVVHNGKVRTKGTTYVSLGQSTRGQQVTSLPIQSTPTGFATFKPGTALSPVPVQRVVVPIGNVQNSNIYNQIIGFCSNNIYDSIAKYNSTVDNTDASYKFYATNTSQDSISMFLLYNHTKLISDNSFIKNLQLGDIYANQPISSAEFYKLDLLDSSKDIKINETRSNRPRNRVSFLRQNTYYKENPLPDDTTADKNGNTTFLSKFREFPSISRDVRMLQILDRSYTSGEYAYRVDFVFEDPSVIFLKSHTYELENAVVQLESLYENLSINRKAIKDGKFDSQKILTTIKDKFKNVLALSNKILKALPNDGFNSARYLDYMINLGNPRSSTDKNNMFFKVLHTLINTLKDLLLSSGNPTNTLVEVSKSSGGLSKLRRRNSLATTSLKSQILYRKSDVGVDFINTTANGTKDNTLLSGKDLSERSAQEIRKFWNADTGFGPTESLIKEKTSFYLTPNRIIGVDEIIDFSSIPGFDAVLKEKVKKTNVAAQGKPTKKSSLFTILESLSNIPASIQVAGNDFSFSSSDIESDNVYDLADVYLRDHGSFKEDNINTFGNSVRQSTDYSGKLDNILSSTEDIVVNGITKLGQTDLVTLGQNIDAASLSDLPPPLQAYKLRNLPASKFNQFVQTFGELTNPSNVILLQNLFGIVVKLQYASIRPDNLGSLQWNDMTSDALQRNKILFCRILPLYNESIGLNPSYIESVIYNEYFVVRSDTLLQALRSNPNLVRPMNDTSVKAMANLEKAIDDKLQSIMSQKTTYKSGTPVAYSKIIH